MNSFLATGPATTIPAPSPVDTTPAKRMINHGSWYPEIDLADARAVLRLDGTVTDERLIHAIVAAISHVGDELADFQIRQLDAPYKTLADVPCAHIDGVSRFVASYRRAVYSTAMADLCERYRSFDATADGNKKADQLEPVIDDHRRTAHWAIADIVGRARMTVELI